MRFGNRNRIRVVALALLALATVAGAQTIQKWKTPDGAVYFGSNPPAGSVQEGEFGSIGRPSSGSKTVDKAGALKTLLSSSALLLEIGETSADWSEWKARRTGLGDVELSRQMQERRGRLETMRQHWIAWNALREEVRKEGGGEMPSWWTEPRVLPTLSDIEGMLR